MAAALRVLVIEDNPDDALVMQRALEKSGHTVAFADSGQRGIDEMQRQPADLVVLDYRLGDMAGTEVLLRIRERFAHVPVVMASGIGSHFIVARAIALGAQAFVSKDDAGFAVKLLEAVDRVIEENRGAAHAPLPDRSSVQSRAQEVKRMIHTLLESSELVGTVGIVGPDGALVSGAVQDKTGAHDVTAVLAGTVQMMLATVATHLGYGRARFFVASFERGSLAMAPLPGNLTLFVTSPAGPAELERLRHEIETAAAELGQVMGPQTKPSRAK